MSFSSKLGGNSREGVSGMNALEGSGSRTHLVSLSLDTLFISLDRNTKGGEMDVP